MVVSKLLRAVDSVLADAGIVNHLDPHSLVLDGPREINEVLVRHWGGDILDEMAIITKSIIRGFYGKPPEYSYFNSCAQGGRQGFELAKNYPTGIAASAPAIHWAQWAPAMHWPQILTNITGEYPHGRELDLLTTLAVQECDGRDGVVDDIILNPKACAFDPFLYIGRNFTCLSEHESMKLSRAAAVIANASWAGPTDSHGNFIWYGLNHGTDLSGSVTGTGIAAKIQLFVKKDPNYDYAAIPQQDYEEIMRKSGSEYDPIVASSNPDLTKFYKAGKKIMTYHGLFIQYDQVIPIQATERYCDNIKEFMLEAQEFYRFYEVPGLPHYFGNGQPATVFDVL
ncbi:Tannase/feruloyl esterase [Daldinia loculata]|uniref:Tannase/feruloyl esterase n=1 Tax=Daldinia loculata TaxID=103429 RepID=UPI0020C4851C|nr:Tannase/feruloyl esterase [Daldinia loculata]KAI1650222.1 Tannase/feruloyl esterase [Daldinia loculata]